MLEKLSGGREKGDERAREREEAIHEREELIRERMEAQGITEEEATRLVVSEEQLAVGTREVQTGEVGIRKEVETRHVHEEVPVRREEVDIERRPITDGYTGEGVDRASIGDGEEIRIPLHAEEAVVEKRVVPTEEIVVRKREVVESQPVDAELRRERVEVDREVREEVRGDDLSDRR